MQIICKENWTSIQSHLQPPIKEYQRIHHCSYPTAIRWKQASFFFQYKSHEWKSEAQMQPCSQQTMKVPRWSIWTGKHLIWDSRYRKFKPTHNEIHELPVRTTKQGMSNPKRGFRWCIIIHQQNTSWSMKLILQYASFCSKQFISTKCCDYIINILRK